MKKPRIRGFFIIFVKIISMADNQALKSTALSDLHTALGAKMVPFAGFNMPVLYDNLIQEHLCVRNAMGVFDVSHMGEVWIEGPKAYDLIEFITTNDVSTLYDGRVQYSCMPNATGGIVDDLLVYRFNAEKYLLVINAGNIDKDLAWIHEQNKNFGATITDVSPEYSLLAIQGPKATEALQKLTSVNLSEIPYYHFVEGELAGLQLIISCTGYTGAGGFELYVKNADARTLWDKVFEAGAEFGIKPIGLGARDTLSIGKRILLVWQRHQRRNLSHRSRFGMDYQIQSSLHDERTPQSHQRQQAHQEIGRI